MFNLIAQLFNHVVQSQPLRVVHDVEDCLLVMPELRVRMCGKVKIGALAWLSIEDLRVIKLLSLLWHFKFSVLLLLLDEVQLLLYLPDEVLCLDHNE